MSNLTDQQKLFVAEYLVDFNAAGAGRRVGFTNGKAGWRMLRNPEVRAAIDAELNARNEAVGVCRDWVLEQMVEVYEECREGVVDRVVNVDGTTTEIRAADYAGALKALDMIAKYTGMTPPEKHELTGKDGGPVALADVSENEAARRVAFILEKGIRAQRTAVDGFDDLLH